MNRRTLTVFSVLLAVACGASFWVGTIVTEDTSEPGARGATETTYYCSMHPHITLPHPGTCSICGMDLVELKAGDGDPGPRALTMSESAMRLAEIETAKVAREFVDASISMVGKIAFDETRVKTITARVPGRLDRLYVNYTGVPIAAGDHLVDIYSPKLYEAQQQLFEALKAVERPESESSPFLRRSSTGTLEAVRKKLLLLGLSTEQVAEIEERKTLSDHILINSPVGGVVVEKLANEGDYVETGTPIYKVATVDRLWVELAAYESDLPWIRFGQDVSFHTEAYPGDSFAGTVSFIDWVVDHRTRTIKVRLNVHNPDGRLKPGMFVRAEAKSTLTAGGRIMAPSLEGKWISPMHPEIVKDAPGTCDICGMDLVPAEQLYGTNRTSGVAPLVIPATAPLVTGRRAVVYVKRPGTASTFEGREIVLGPRAGDRYVVLSGLEGGEEVVVRGNFKIDSDLQIRAKPSMMNPRGGGSGGLHQHDHGAAARSEPRDTGTPQPGEPSETRRPAPPRVPTELRGSVADLFARYLKIEAALVESELDSAQSSFAHLGNLLESVSVESLEAEAAAAWREVVRTARNAVVLASTSKDLAELRGSFSVLSEAMREVERRFGHGGGTLYEIHCPMALGGDGASWLQSSREVRNPYFGESMLTCGNVRAELPPRAGEEAAGSSGPEHGGHGHE